jgi:RimJ/RimL family protein N-acetyltransferase
MAAADAIDWGFETSRIRARLIDSRDRDLYLQLYTDPAVMAHIGATKSEAEAIDVFEKVLGYNAEIPVRARYWRLSQRGSDETVGMQSIVRAAADPATVELGMMLLPQGQGQGLGIEASERMVALLFGNHWRLDTQTVFALHASANARVARLGATLGFQPVDQPAPARAEWRLSREEWRARSVGALRSGE